MFESAGGGRKRQCSQRLIEAQRLVSFCMLHLLFFTSCFISMHLELHVALISLIKTCWKDLSLFIAWVPQVPLFVLH